MRKRHRQGNQNNHSPQLPLNFIAPTAVPDAGSLQPTKKASPSSRSSLAPTTRRDYLNSHLNSNKLFVDIPCT
ncbi:hypothetical protein L5515_010422 [Caenorhabditis briggsae]|uniref:Uncharacterized protein n=1 Tax=Caenorhabditis briggsae TaxID=6238 RepID=A0AAE9ESK6_CAEBR|nr:hypothetical protein L3Y34_003267 [Caenorhabditis briggsae]ULT93652.1 hypothetical protein L3Y34_003268 [Caenorhabditis briggsae]UMM26920.1 hypothetical protein L5515_010422 [Caenorhabditis briggsae]